MITVEIGVKDPMAQQLTTGLTASDPSVVGIGAPEVANYRLNVRNILKLRDRTPRAFGAIRFDSNNNCNLRCVYCHNARSDELVDPEDLRAFLCTCVASVEEFQIGCVMEPTLDLRLCDFMDIIATSLVTPRHSFRLQTNGILLHRHDALQMRAAGLTHLSVSVDSPHASTHKDLRGGTSLAKVERNLRAFHQACPEILMIFLTTVTNTNIGSLRDLITWGLDVGAQKFVFRQIFYYPTSSHVDHSRMQSLLVSEEEFAEFRNRITGEFARRASVHFFENSILVGHADRVTVASETLVEPARTIVGVRQRD
ncbi:MAG: radical SAM protein [Steroidobacterales bacterium]